MSKRIKQFFVTLGAALLVSGALAGTPAFAVQGDCSQPVTNGANPTASDCLFILRVAVGSATCSPEPCVCDPTGGGGTTASDALLCLKKAVGQAVTISCPCDPVTTTSSTTVTTSSTTTSSTTVPETTTTLGGTTTTVPATTTTTGGGTTTTIDGGTTTTLPVTTTTIDGGTTTTVAPTTTTIAVTTTTMGVAECPTSANLTIVAGTRDACTTNTDCGVVGTCNTGIGRCQTLTELDTGYTGISHDADLTDNVFVKASLDCGGDGPACGECTIAGIDPAPGYCRCADDNRAICDEPFVADNDDCGGAVCNCYIGPPLALSAGNTPACIVNRLADDLTGTTNVDTGDSASSLSLRSIVFTGEGNWFPCPHCEGDTTVGDGQRDGTCVYGPNEGASCDSDGFNQTFEAPDGKGHSLDCFPNPGKNVSGEGLVIKIDQTTGTQQLGSAVPCVVIGPSSQLCQCGICSGNASLPCSSDQECVDADAGTTCQRRSTTSPSPNQCETECTDTGDAVTGLCDGPSDKGCDGLLRANGEAFIQCQTNADCIEANIGIDAGSCTASKQRPCFLPTINAQGIADPETPLGVGIFCIGPTASDAINLVAGLPGPGRVFNQGIVEHQCTGGAYVPGVGCP